MFLGRSMAMLALNAGHKRSGIACRVAVKTLCGILLAHLAAGCFEKIGGRGIGGAQRPVQTVDGAEKTDTAFVWNAVFFENVGLAGISQSKRPRNRKREARRAIAHAVQILFDAVGIVSLF